MALIKCPECGKEVSDRAAACIHCGFPLHEKVVEESSEIQMIKNTISEYIENPAKYANIDALNKSIAPTVRMAKVKQIAGCDSLLFDAFAQLVMLKPEKFSWVYSKELFELVDFEKIEKEKFKALIDFFAEGMDECITYGDGSVGRRNYDTIFWYPIHMLLKYGKPEDLQQLNEVLKKEKIPGKQGSLYESLMYWVENGASINTGVIKINQNRQINKNVLKCPKCGSDKVAIGQRGFSLITGFLGAGQTMNRCGNCGYKWKPTGR